MVSGYWRMSRVVGMVVGDFGCECLRVSIDKMFYIYIDSVVPHQMW